MTLRSRRNDDTGAALISSLMVVVLMAGLTAGITALIIADTQVRTLDGTRAQAFYVTHAGLEKLTADLGDLFSVNFAPTAAQINALTVTPPPLGATWQRPDGTNGYRITFPTGAAGNPVASTMTVLSGPFQGLIGMATPYQINVTARLADRSEANLTRTLQTVAIPVFQFGFFSENDLSFFAGPDFDFGGRVHSNSNLFFAAGNGSTLTLSDRVTAVGEIVRTHLANGFNDPGSYQGNVEVIRAPGLFRDLAKTEGSVVTTLGSALNDPTWMNLSTGTYNYNITNTRTGARRLDLPITTFGATPIDLVRRPAANENAINPNLLGERFYSLASLRILLSDNLTDLQVGALPGLTATPPVPLGIAEPYATSSAPPRPAFAESPGVATVGVRTPAATPLLGGFIKIEKQTVPGTWVDVTLEILNLGINSPQLPSANTGAAACADHTPNAIIRLQRPWDNGGVCYTLNQVTTAGGNATVGRRHVGNTLFDPREGLLRDNALPSMTMGGIMHYVEIDARNLSRWFAGTIPAANCPIACTGANSLNVNGFTVYFSDRRGNRNSLLAPAPETGEYGFEDKVNAASALGTPNNVLNAGEDFNGNNALEVYGQTPRLPPGINCFAPVPCAPFQMTAPFVGTARPWTELGAANQIDIARRNPPIFFRRALKLTNGALGNLVAPGLTIASENPVYVQGNWNANAAGFGNPHVATAVLADSVTLLSNNWNDRNSFVNPYDHDTNTERDATTTWYRLAIIAGKGLSFPQPAGTGDDFGTDGGAHNFLRYIENWGGRTLNFRGSIVSFFVSRQATGTYKCCDTVYSPPTRAYAFDTDFLTPALLPPRTPMFRDVNATGFAQIIRPQ